MTFVKINFPAFLSHSCIKIFKRTKGRAQPGRPYPGAITWGVIVGLIIGTLPGQSQAGLILSDAAARYALSVPGNNQPQTWVYTATTDHLDGTIDYGTYGIATGSASVNISFTQQGASVDVQARADSVPYQGSNFGPQSTASAWVDMNYQMALIETRPIPTILPFSQIPISVTGSAMINDFGGSPGGEASVVGPGSFNIYVRNNPPGSPTNITLTKTISLVPGQKYDVDLHADVSVYAIYSYIPFSSGQVVADPVFTFDQAKFEEWMIEYGMGDQIWNLTDYFEFQFSPNLSGPCHGDCDQDGDVDGAELNRFIIDFLSAAPPGNCLSDYNNDGQLDALDLDMFTVYFGRMNCSN